MALDEELIARNNQSNEEADSSESSAPSLRETIQKAKSGTPPEATGDLRADKLASLRQQKNKSKEGEEGMGGKAASAALSPARQSLAKLLQFSWENLIDTFGLTLIWIDLHYILSFVFGKKLFCDLGEEWIPSKPGMASGGAENDLVAKAGNSIGAIEKGGCLLLNLGCLFLILGVLSLLTMIAAALDNPLRAGWELMKELAKLIAEVFISK